MEHLNHILFLGLNAPAHPGLLMLALAKFFGVYAIFVVPLLLAAGWLRGNEPSRKVWLEASVSMLAGLLINQFIALLWPHPRPFMLGLGHNLISHAANSSFPSDHLTGLWAFSFSLLMHRSQRMTAVALTLLACRWHGRAFTWAFTFRWTCWGQPWLRCSVPGWRLWGHPFTCRLSPPRHRHSPRAFRLADQARMGAPVSGLCLS